MWHVLAGCLIWCGVSAWADSVYYPSQNLKHERDYPHYGGFGTGFLHLYPDGSFGRGCIRSGGVWQAADFGQPRAFGVSVRTADTAWSSPLAQQAGVEVRQDASIPVCRYRYVHRSLPIVLSMTAWYPLIPNDAKHSSLPAVLFEFIVDNSSGSSPADVELSFPIPAPDVTGVAEERDASGLVGLTVLSSAAGGGACCGMVLNDGPAEVRRTAGGGDERSAVLASEITVPPGAVRRIVFVFTWGFPVNVIACEHGRDDAGHYWMNFFGDAPAIARFLLREYRTLRERTFRWHRRMESSSLPAWLKELILVNNRALIWNSAFLKDGRACFREGGCYTIWGTMDHRFYSSIANLIFLPEAEWGEMRWWAHTQRPHGGIRHDFGSDHYCWRNPVDYFFDPDAGNSWGDLTPKWILNVYRNYLWTGDVEGTRSLFPAVQRGVAFMIKQDVNGDGVSDTHKNTYDNFLQSRNTIYNVQMHAAGFRAAGKLAEVFGDSALAAECLRRANLAAEVMDRRFFHARRGYYKEGPGDTRSLSAQLAGQFYADFLGLGDLITVSTRVAAALRYIHANNVKPREGVIRTFLQPDRTDMWNALPLATYCSLAIYRGLADIGLADAQLVWDTVYNKLDDEWSQALGIGEGPKNIQCDHYMNTPLAWHLLIALQGLRWDLPRRCISIRPSLPASFEGVLEAPVVGARTWGYLKYSEREPGVRRIALTLDTPLTFDRVGIPDPAGGVIEALVGGVPVPVRVEHTDQGAEAVFATPVAVGEDGLVLTIRH